MAVVNTSITLSALQARNKAPIVYHALNVTEHSPTLNVQIKVANANTSNLVIMVRYGKMPMPNLCDFVKRVRTIQLTAGKNHR